MRALLVALAVVLAGCPGAVPGGTPTPEPEYPPGVTAAGVTDPAALADAHGDALENTSYTLVSNRTIRYTNGTLSSRLTVRLRLAADRQFHVVTATAGPDGPLFLGQPPASAEFWSDGDVYVRALTRDGETTYNQFTPPDNFVGTWRYWRATVPFGGRDGHARETIRALFEDVPADVTGVRTADGATVYRLRGEGADSGGFAKAGDGPARDVTLEADVTESGVVRRINLSYVTFLGNRSARVEWTVRYLDVGDTTAERPAWYDRAVADRDATSASLAGQSATVSSS